METSKKSSAMDWILFLVSTAVMIYMVVVVPEWSWLALPFSSTYFVKAMNWI